MTFVEPASRPPGGHVSARALDRFASGALGPAAAPGRPVCSGPSRRDSFIPR